MTWYVHRNGGPGTPITSAHRDLMEGYNDEALADGNVEIVAYHAPMVLAERCGAVNVERDRRLDLGYVDAITGKTIQTRPGTDDTARMAALGAAAGLAMGTVPPPEFTLITADNSLLVLAAADTYALLAGRVAPWVSATILHAAALKASLRAGQAVDLAAGWP